MVAKPSPRTQPGSNEHDREEHDQGRRGNEGCAWDVEAGENQSEHEDHERERETFGQSPAVHALPRDEVSVLVGDEPVLRDTRLPSHPSHRTRPAQVGSRSAGGPQAGSP